MKPIPFFLALSLLANLALAVVFFRGGSPVASLSGSGASSSSSSSRSNSTSQISDPHLAPPSSSSTLNSQPSTLNSASIPPRTLWDRIGSDDLAALLANLNAAGFPPKLARRIVAALVSERFAARNNALWSGDENTPYWKVTGGIMSGSKEYAEMQRINREQQALMKSLFGHSLFLDEPNAAANIRRYYGDLSIEKIEALVALQQDYQEMREKLNLGNVSLPSDRERIRLLEKEQRTDLEKLLTPAELSEYDLRNSSVSGRLRSPTGIGQLQLTEAEYRALAPLYQATENKFVLMTDASGTSQPADARRAAEEELRKQVQSVLSPARYAEYLQASDPSAYQENRLAARLGLPLSAAAAVSAFKRDYTAQADTIRKNNDIPLEARNAQLSALAAEAEARVSAAYGGARGLNAYREYGGNWLKNLQPRPSSPSSPPYPAPRG